MATTWVMAPVEYGASGPKAGIYRRCWEYDFENGVISIGWDLGEAPVSREHLEVLWMRYADPAWADPGRRMLEYFWFDIQDGDTVIARAGALRYIAIGEFAGEAYYDQNAEGLAWGCSFRKVMWEKDPRERLAPFVLGRNTLYPLDSERAALFGV